MWTRPAFLLIIVLFVYGCKDNGTQSQPSADADETLRQLMIGGWKVNHPWEGSSQSSSAYWVDFRADGTFADTLFGAFNLIQPSDTLTIVRSGNYSVLNQVVEYSNISLSYHTLSGQPRGFGTYKWPQAVVISGDSMTITEANVLFPLDSAASQLVGRWRFVYWCYMGSPDSLNPQYTGRRQVTHSFLSDSGYSQAWKDLERPDWPEQTWQGSYSYRPPSLQANSGGFQVDVRVEFFQSRMYWFYDYWNIKLGRIG